MDEGEGQGMDSLTVRCPRCKQTLAGDDASLLADELIRHVEHDHGHAPPREHVVARIHSQNSTD
jgi:hypothetical protein